ncbi:MAG: thiol peroxidase [Muribaculaceae bacterium]|nr:thiol peroxidase [Muribaculaceae bacterium]MDE5972043.1 thiol peroxidase [Muribaculaceae bacterium]MDE6462232.1 thiol peroxidase [Muribaculaceae bacterium]MDE6508836.1 thiol peroxidase [Muribaculaceae bacterium]
METIYFQGSPCHTYGQMPRVGEKAPCFTLVRTDLQEIRCTDFLDTRVILNIFPSLDTDVCALSVRRFNKEAAALPDVKIINVSMDLPFAAQRFVAAEGIDNAIVASAFRSPLFAQKYGLQIIDGPLAGLLARAVIVMDRNRNIIYEELVPEIAQEPDYKSAIASLQ